MAEIRIYQCSICGDKAGAQDKRKIFSHDARSTIRMLKSMPTVELTIRFNGPGEDYLICDSCNKRINAVLDEISVYVPVVKKTAS